MLIAHAASTCDVCLEGYHEDCSYHSIPCGHVFCLPCLVSTSPPRCPLCRHEFTPYSMRKLHLTLPSERDMAARRLELKLVQSSPEMTLAESLTLFQEVQEWLEGEGEDEFLVLRAFAAVMCGFHETKDKLLQTEAHAEKNEALLLRSLDEARNATHADEVDYKSKYQVTKSELTTLRAEYANLRAQAEQAQQRSAEILAQYAQAQAYTQSQSLSESLPAVRRTSNPLPTPPRPIEIPFLKLIETHPSLNPQEIKGKAKDTTVSHTDADDPMTSAFVPTLASIKTRNSSSSADVRSEVTTLVFKPPKRMPVWDTRNSSYARVDASENSPNHTYSDSSSHADPYIEAKAPGSGYSRMNELPQVARELSNLSLAQSKNASYRSVSYADSGVAKAVAGSLPVNPPPQPQAHGNGYEHGHNSLPGQKAAVRPIRDESSPHTASNLPPLTLPTSFAPSMVPTASRSGDRGITTSGVKLRRASSPVVWLSDTSEPMYHPVSGPSLPYRDWRGGGTRTVHARTRTRGAVGDTLSHVKVNGRISRPHASPSRNDRRQMDGVQVMDDFLPQMQDEYVSSRKNQSIEFPPSPRSTGYVDSRQSHGTSMSPDPSQSMTLHDHQALSSSQPPSPVRERVHSHPHHATPTISLNRRHAYAMSPINGRLPLDISIAGPGATFPMMNSDRPRAVPVAEV